MAWETRNGRGRYYTRSKKQNGRTVRTYIGTGPRAEQAAAEDEARREKRKALADSLRAEEQRHADAIASLIELGRLVDLLMKATLTQEGYHLHARGEWRRRRHACNDNKS